MGSDTILTKTSLRRYEKTLAFIKSSAPHGKNGWKIIASEKWTSPTGEIGLRTFLRKITP